MIEIINTFDAAHQYLYDAQQSGVKIDELWDRHMIAPYWETISQYAPFDHSFMKPKPIRNITALEQQLRLLDALDFSRIIEEFERIMALLPKEDDDPIVVAFFPLDDDEQVVKEQQNGVVGACVFGNIILNINPLANDFEKWLPYVFAHEYYHSVWGNHWYMEKQGAGLKNTFLEALINEGEADYFATKVNPELQPKWLSVDDQLLMKSWNALKNSLDEQDRSKFDRLMFGDEEGAIPWTAGYKLGYYMVSNYMKKFNLSDFNDLLTTAPEAIYQNSPLN